MNWWSFLAGATVSYVGMVVVHIRSMRAMERRMNNMRNGRERAR